jgi:hypothetical protein
MIPVAQQPALRKKRNFPVAQQPASKKKESF